MPTRQATADLARIIATLKAVRQEHIDAITEIDDQFNEFGIAAEGTRRRGRPPKAKNGRRKKAAKRKVAKNGRRKKGKKAAARKAAKKKAGRRKFTKTANDFILDLLKGGKTLTTAQINGKWRQAQRSGAANNTLSTLAKAGKVKREKIEDGQGSRYSAA